MYEYGGSGDSTILVPGFSVKRRIGVGGFATVYEAIQEDVQAPVALKVLAVDHTDERVRARFERECRTMGRLRDQRGIVPVYQSAFTSDGRPVIVMAYMPGGSLLDRLRQAGTLSVEEVTTIGVTLSRALQAAHDQGIYHRDIKPENILIDRDGQVALADFGLATVDDLLTSTRTDASLTPPHAPPERFLATEDTNLAAGDIYSLASTLYQLLTGRPPFGTSSDGGLAALINRVIADPPPTINRPDMTAGLTNAIVLGLSKNPNDRPVSPAMFGELLAPGMIAQTSTDPGLLTLPTGVATSIVANATSKPPRVVAPGGASVAAQWLADPSGRYTLRYWDGELWTGHVTRGNETLWDPLQASDANSPSSIVANTTSMPTRVPEATPTSMPTRVIAPVIIPGAQPPNGSPPTKRKRGLIMIAIGVAVLLIGGVAVAMNSGKDSGSKPQATTSGASGGSTNGSTGPVTQPSTDNTIPTGVGKIVENDDKDPGSKPRATTSGVSGGATTGSSVPGTIPPTTGTTPKLPSNVMTGNISIGGVKQYALWGIGSGFGSIWLCSTADQALYRINPSDLTKQSITLGGKPQGVAFASGFAWVSNYALNAVQKIEISSGKLSTTQVPVGVQPWGIASGSGSLWVANYGSNTVSRINALNNSVVTINVGTAPQGVTFIAGSAWVANTGSNTVSRINPSNNSVTSTINVGPRPYDLTNDGVNPWVSNREESPGNDFSLMKLNAANNTISQKITMRAAPFGITFAGGSVWAALLDAGVVVRVKASSPYNVEAEISVGQNPWGLTSDGTSVWAANRLGNYVSRIRI